VALIINYIDVHLSLLNYNFPKGLEDMIVMV
jgi:hypothetical protein